jgi:predicted Holliday junction resolvase-like endonuclease
MDAWSIFLKDRGRKQALLWFVVLCALILVVGIEGYYIYSLRDTIEKQSEELNHTSLQIQTLRQERISLEEELRLIKKMAGEQNDGNSTQR